MATRGGEAWHGVARRGMVRLGRRGKARPGLAGRGEAQQARRGWAGRGKAGHGKAQQALTPAGFPGKFCYDFPGKFCWRRHLSLSRSARASV